ncbi:hypothetical protein, partial [Paenacidovorax caeni]
RKGIGLFGDCQSTNLRTVNHYFPQIARRTFFYVCGSSDVSPAEGRRRAQRLAAPTANHEMKTQ